MYNASYAALSSVVGLLVELAEVEFDEVTALSVAEKASLIADSVLFAASEGLIWYVGEASAG